MYKIKLHLKGLLVCLNDLIADLSAFTYIVGWVEEENYTHKLATVLDSITCLSAR
jgi:hydrogenase-4 membrane subunit HyfE